MPLDGCEKDWEPKPQPRWWQACYCDMEDHEHPAPDDCQCRCDERDMANDMEYVDYNEWLRRTGLDGTES
jgi:hypothetical protein